MASASGFVTTATPMRLSFVGGGTDLPDFFLEHAGAVVSTAIDKHVYVTVKRHSTLFEERYRLNYSETELVQSIDDIDNMIIRECLRLVPVEPPLYVSTVGDIPASSGLGSSGSFAVGMLSALHELRGERVSAGQLAEEACYVERDVLGQPVGNQDQYAAAFGGLNYIEFRKSGRTVIDPLTVAPEVLETLFASSMLFWTGVIRSSGSILEEQKSNIGARTEQLTRMRDLAKDCRNLFLDGFDIETFGAMMHRNWVEKRELASSISNSGIDADYEKARAAGALGGKIAGAGGGGFLLLLVPASRQQAVREALGHLEEIPFGFEPHGSRVLYSGGS